MTAALPKSMLFAFPSDIAVDLLCHWIDVFDLVRLEMSITSVTIRPEFLGLLRQLPGISTISDHFSGNLIINQWAIQRNIRVSSVDINESFFNEDGEFRLSLALNQIQHISVQFFLSNNIKEHIHPLLSSCSSLKSVTFDDIVALEDVSSEVLNRLNVLHVSNLGRNDVFLDNIARYCQHLTSLQLLLNTDTYDLSRILRSNPALTYLEVVAPQSKLNLLLKQYPALQSVTFHIAEAVSLPMLVESLRLRPDLKHLEVESDINTFFISNKIGKKSVHLYFGYELVAESEVVSFLSLIRNVNDLYFGTEVTAPFDAVFDWIVEQSRTSLTRLDLRNIPTEFVMSIVGKLSSLTDLTWSSLEDPCSDVPELRKLRYLRWSIWLTLAHLCTLLTMCQNVVEASLYLQLTDDELDSWVSIISDKLSHIALVEFTVLSGVKNAYSKCQFRHGQYIDANPESV